MRFAARGENVNVYKLRADRSRYLNFYISPDEIEAKLGDYFLLDEPSWAEFWKPVEARFHDDSDKKNVVTPPDITVWYTSNNLALNQKAFDALGDALGPYGEWLPVTCAGNPYSLLHTTRKTDMEAVDLKHSDRVIDEANFIELRKLAFVDEAIRDLLIFQTPYSGYRNLYGTEKFKSLVEGADLKGLLFCDDLVSIL